MQCFSYNFLPNKTAPGSGFFPVSAYATPINIRINAEADINNLETKLTSRFVELPNKHDCETQYAKIYTLIKELRDRLDLIDTKLMKSTLYQVEYIDREKDIVSKKDYVELKKEETKIQESDITTNDVDIIDI